MDSLYITDFNKFLSHTDEKSVLFEAIAREIKLFKVNSLLDIGAGNGLLAIPLSKKVKKYTAIEPKSKHADLLRQANLEVIKHSFPTDRVSRTYDGILASHVISYEDDNYKSFILSAWKYLKPGGIFMLITHKGEENEWTELLNDAGLGNSIYSNESFEDMKSLLQSLGEFELKKIVSCVKTDNTKDMIEALSFVASDGVPERKKAFMSRRSILEKILKAKYRQTDTYFFPFNHFLLITQKLRLS